MDKNKHLDPRPPLGSAQRPDGTTCYESRGKKIGEVHPDTVPQVSREEAAFRRTAAARMPKS